MIKIIVEDEDDRLAVVKAHMEPDTVMFGGAEYLILEDHGDHLHAIGGCSKTKVTFTSGGSPPWETAAGGGGGDGGTIDIGPVG